MKIEIVTGFACNNFCKFCSVGKRDFNKTTEVIKGEIDEAAAEKPEELNFTGGEPTIRKDIVELVSYAGGKFKNIRVTTNGRMLSYQDFANRLVDAGMTGAIFSIHSHKAEVHNYLTSVDGCFGQAMRGMENLSELSGNIGINTVINLLNYRNLKDLARMLFRFDIKSLCFIYPTVYGNLLDNMRLLPRYSEVSKHVVEAVELVTSHGVMCWAMNIPACFLPGNENLSSLTKMRTKMYWPDVRADLDVKKYEDKVKPLQCDSCTVREVCPGIPKEYHELFGGGEVRPVRKRIELEY
jgi:MoaA/NifB/PqqE/SkfB family radical SAM enzyme